MHSKSVVRRTLALSALPALLLMGTQGAHAQTETVLYSFKGGADGSSPYLGTPVMDKAGNLYGTTEEGGTNNLGTVWKVTPSGSETVIWSFGSGADGAVPEAGLAIDKAGNLYGTTSEGGAYALGAAFKITPSGTETVLWSFGNGMDGNNPAGTGPVLDKNGNLFGTTEGGGTYGLGVVFEIASSGTENVLWNFGANPKDQPRSEGIMLAKNGNLYGTSYGQSQREPFLYGTVWELTPSGTETVLYTFDPLHTKKDGDWPTANMVMDKKGNLYGTCHNGGGPGHTNGTVFKLTPSATEKVIHVFDGADGDSPYGNTIMDKDGNLYSAAFTGDAEHEGGLVWKMTRSGKETILYTFAFNNGSDGFGPGSGVVMDKQGNIYGTTVYGGTGSCSFDGLNGCGTVYKITP